MFGTIKYRGSFALSVIDSVLKLQITSKQTTKQFYLLPAQPKRQSPALPPRRPNQMIVYQQVQPRVSNPKPRRAVVLSGRPAVSYKTAQARTAVTNRAVVVQRAVPAAVSTVTTNSLPLTRMARSEQCCVVAVDVDTVRLSDYAINPGNETLFPWCSRIAPFFDQYLFESLQFRYVPSCGSTTVGQLTMAIDYDPVDSNVGIGQTEVAAMEGAVHCQLYTPSVLKFNRSLLSVSTHKFYTSSDESYNDNARFNHVGRLLIYVAAEPSAKTTYGTIFVDYTIQLVTPQLAGPGFSNNAAVTNNNAGHVASDPLGTVTTATLVSTKPDSVATPARTKRIVKIIDGIVTAVGQIAPFIAFVAKLFIGDYCPILPGVYEDYLGVEHSIALADVPGDAVMVLSSSQCRGGVLIAHFYGTYTTLVTGSRPVVTILHSLNIRITPKLSFPYSLQNGNYIAATPTLTTATLVAEFDYVDQTGDKAWLKPVIAQSGSADLPAWNSANYSFVNLFSKADLPNPS